MEVHFHFKTEPLNLRYLTVTIMNAITKMLGIERGLKVINEKPYHQENFLRYYTRTMENGEVQFWAFPTSKNYDGLLQRDWSWELKEFGTDNGFYFGKFRDGELIKPDNFYTLPMPMQRGALKLYEKFGVYK